MQSLLDFIKYIPALIVAIVIHEFSHAAVALAFGDNSARSSGRVSLNPFKHLDPLGLISLFIFRFGWAKPVPVNSSNFKNYNLGMFFVSIAGIVSNFLFAFLCSNLLKLNLFTNEYIISFLLMSIVINLNLAYFNLIPLPPLDGSNILLSFFSKKTAYEVQRYSRYTHLILLFLIISGTISKVLGMVVIPTFNWMLSWVKIY